MAIIMHNESAAVFSWKGDILEEYWYLILNALVQREDVGKGHRPDLIFDYGGDMNILIHEGKTTDDLFLKYSTIPDPSST